jgi:hypothetical protein
MRLAFAGFAFALALAARGMAAQVQRGTAVAVRLPAYDTPVVLDTMETLKHHEDVTRVGVMIAARQALEELEIPITYTDANRGIVLNAELSLIRRLGKYRLSQLLDCGTNLNGAVADQYRIRMAVGVLVDSVAPSASEFRVVLAAGATSTEGASRPPLACSSTGALEERVAKLLSAKIWGGT